MVFLSYEHSAKPAERLKKTLGLKTRKLGQIYVSVIKSL